MRNQPLASKAGLLGILFSLISSGLIFAQVPYLEPNLIPEESGPQQIVPPSASTPSATPAPSSPTWFDSLFNQKLPVQFGFRLGGAYSDNIFYQTKKTYDYIAELSPSLVLTLGQKIKLDHGLDQETLDVLTDAGNLNYLQITYTPTLRLYDKNSNLDDVDEYADAVYSHLFGKLTLSIEQKYEKLSQPTIQINAQGTLINRDVFTTTARANYIYSDQLSTYGTFTQTATTYQSGGYTDNTEWLADYFFLYQLFPKLSIGLGPRIGFEDIDQAPNQDFQAALAHFYFLATSKFTVDGAAGAEIREFEDNSAPTEITPIVEGTATYAPFDSMTLTLDGERHRIVDAGFAGYDYTASIASLDVRQRFFQIIYLTLKAGYENDKYTVVGGGPARNDNIFFGTAGLEWESYRGIKIDAGYEYLRDDSNVNFFTFTENRLTVSATVKY